MLSRSFVYYVKSAFRAVMSVPLTERIQNKRQKTAPEVFPNEYAENERKIWPFQILKVFNGTAAANWSDDGIKCPFDVKFMKILQVTYIDTTMPVLPYGFVFSDCALDGRPLFHVYNGMMEPTQYTVPINLATNSATNFSISVPDATNPLVRDLITPGNGALLIFGGELWTKI